MASTTASSSPNARRARVLRTLSQTQHLSGLAFTSFAVVHLAAPSLALLAPRGDAHEVATGTMLLGRVWYQSAWTEPVLVWGAVGIHLAASFVKKGVVLFWAPAPRSELKKHDDDEDAAVDGGSQAGKARVPAPNRFARALRAALRRAALVADLHTLSGTLLVPFVLHHAYLNRIVPAQSSPPIHALSPSELDYTYVAHGFGAGSGTGGAGMATTARSAFSAISYAALISLSVYHSAHGVRKVAQARKRAITTVKTSSDDARLQKDTSSSLSGSVKSTSAVGRRRRWDLGAGIATAIVCGGLIRLVREADGVPPFLVNRYEACYTLVWPYSVWR